MRFLRETWKHRWLLVMSLPAVILFIMFNYIPIFGLVMAFKNFDISLGIFNSEWCGFANFRLLFLSSATFWRLTRNTIGYYLLFTLLGTIGNILVALGVNEFVCKKLGRFLQSCMILPTFITYIAVSYIVYAFLAPDNGLLNNLLASFGGTKVNWYMNESAWPIILPAIYVWKSIGYGSVLYLSVLAGIDTEMYEAAELDGATTFQRIWHITMPMLVPMITIMTLLGLGGMMHSDTGLFYQVTQNLGSIKNTTQVLDSYILDAITSSSSFGMTTAVTLYQSVVGCIMVVSTNLIVRRFAPENALF